jgi:hypothetical protein
LAQELAWCLLLCVRIVRRNARVVVRGRPRVRVGPGLICVSCGRVIAHVQHSHINNLNAPPWTVLHGVCTVDSERQSTVLVAQPIGWTVTEFHNLSPQWPLGTDLNSIASSNSKEGKTRILLLFLFLAVPAAPRRKYQ